MALPGFKERKTPMLCAFFSSQFLKGKRLRDIPHLIAWGSYKTVHRHGSEPPTQTLNDPLEQKPEPHPDPDAAHVPAIKTAGAVRGVAGIGPLVVEARENRGLLSDIVKTVDS